jgi:isopentenyl-diphosphate delta-isomerase
VADPVVLVDGDGASVGVCPKLEAHRRGLLHSAISVLLFNGRGSVLLQQRALSKYHSGGRWANTCCGHPRPGELVLNAAVRRLAEEMGVRVPLSRAFRFRYRTPVDRGLIEHEVDHVFVGHFDGEPSPDANEVAAWAWVPLVELGADLARHPTRYAAWLPFLLVELAANARQVRVALANARRRALLRTRRA